MKEYEFNLLLNKAKYDPDALQVLYFYYYNRSINYLRKQYGLYIAEEAVQQFFLQLLSGGKEYSYVKYPTIWVYTCCENIAKRLITKENRELPIQEMTPYKDVVSDEEILGDFYDLIAQQDEISQKILKLHYIDGYSLKEISNILNISYSNIRQKYSRTLKKMKKSLKVSQFDFNFVSKNMR